MVFFSKFLFEFKEHVIFLLSTVNRSFLLSGLVKAPRPVSVCPRLLRSTGSALQQSGPEASCIMHQQDQGSKPALRRLKGPAEG